MSATSNPSVAVIIVNWNSWQDVIECLESLFVQEYKNFCIFLCDNNSSDSSLNKIACWASEYNKIKLPEIAFKSDRIDHLHGVQSIVSMDYSSTLNLKLILIDTGANLGFSGGNNVGIKLAQSICQFEYFWLLNPDTCVEGKGLSALVTRMQQSDQPGMCGSQIRFYHNRDTVQALNGAVFNKWFGIGKPIGAYKKVSQVNEVRDIEERTDYVTGASLMLSQSFIENVGLLNEAYFLYFEEIDLATRNQGRFKIGYAHDSIIYHKEGGSIGSSSQKGLRSIISEKFLLESKLKYTAIHHPVCLPTIYIYSFLQILSRILRGHGDKARMMFNTLIMTNPFSKT